ncbi:pilus assembly protein PilP [Catenovulum sp. 2E275]|uniref:pilus assembly protein PilP n=1 Tax=Catenovulum sp. 2E275 TaxID=2980497 RepID=UPI0021D3DAA9|nr:pilus assembly protein PilP [Catenovulum sp. 2E275]MCU4675834.1 pilus assembly protein PilP [Catenovulum sp. 2E275]
MIKPLCIFIGSLLLFGCGKDLTDLQAFTQQVQANAQTDIEPILTVKEFTSFEYSVEQMRSPFVKPQPEMLTQTKQADLNCLQPDFNRDKQALEKYPLDTIKMRGTLGEKGKLYALASVAGGQLYRVKQGDYIGLFHGRVEQITPEYIKLRELIPDGSGCWVIRQAEISIFAKSDTAGNQ